MTDRTEALDIETIESRLGDASAGDWFNAVEVIFVRTDDMPDDFGYSTVHTLGEMSMEADAVFVAHAREDIEALLQALRASNEERERVRELVEKWRALLEGDLTFAPMRMDGHNNIIYAADELEAALSHPMVEAMNDAAVLSEMEAHDD